MTLLNRRIGDQGRYLVVEQIGAGGMGTVFRAQDTRLRSDVVVKILAPAYASHPQVRERFVNEALIQANLPHQNIVTATDIVQEPDLLAIVMEYAQGQSLEQHLVASGGRLPPQRILQVMGPVMEAMAFAHARGVVHRDLKPANILLDWKSGREVPRVMDFGIAKILTEAGQGMTREGSVLGTPSYMPPEQLKGQIDLDQRADVYALGAILYQLATGVLPFGEGSEYTVIHAVLSGQAPPPPSRVAVGVPPAFDGVVARAMAYEREQRYPDVRSLRADLEAAVLGRPTVGATAFAGHAATQQAARTVNEVAYAPPMMAPPVMAPPAMPTPPSRPGVGRGSAVTDPPPPARPGMSAGAKVGLIVGLGGGLLLIAAVVVIIVVLNGGGEEPPADDSIGEVAPSPPEPTPTAAAPQAPLLTAAHIQSPDLWRPGNRWVYTAVRVAGDGVHDEVAPFEARIVREVKSSEGGAAITGVAIEQNGAIWGTRKYTYTIDPSCIVNSTKGENNRPVVCVGGVNRTSIAVLGRQMEVAQYSAGEITAYFAPEIGLVQWTQRDEGTGRLVTNTLAGYKVGARAEGEWSYAPFNCEWSHDRRVIKGKTLDKSEDPSSPERVLAARAGLDETTARFAKSQLKERAGYPLALAVTDGVGSAVAIVDRGDEIVWERHMPCAADLLGAYIDERGGQGYAVFGCANEEGYRALLFRRTGAEVQAIAIATPAQMGAEFGIQLTASLDACTPLVWKRVEKETWDAALQLDWEAGRAFRINGTLPINVW